MKNFPTPNHEHGYTESFLKEEMKKRRYKWELFVKWMRGQTIGIVGDEHVYFTRDVLSYVNSGGPRAKITD